MELKYPVFCEGPLVVSTQNAFEIDLGSKGPVCIERACRLFGKFLIAHFNKLRRKLIGLFNGIDISQPHFFD